jgi:hypothetical protein
MAAGKLVQRAMRCRCGKPKILALGLCASCYSMKRQDEEYYGGLREVVLNRDGRRCRACPNPERRKLCVHHRVPGVSKLDLMITLGRGFHAIMERTKMVLAEMTPLLLGPHFTKQERPVQIREPYSGARRNCFKAPFAEYLRLISSISRSA